MIFLVFAGLFVGVVAISAYAKNNAIASAAASSGPRVSTYGTNNSRPDLYPTSQHVREQSEIIIGSPLVFTPRDKDKGVDTGTGAPPPTGGGGTGVAPTVASPSGGGGGGAGGYGGYGRAAGGSRSSSL